MAVFTEAELDRLVGGLAPGEFSEAEALRFVRWCEEARISAALVEGVIRGRIRVAGWTEDAGPVFEAR